MGVIRNKSELFSERRSGFILMARTDRETRSRYRILRMIEKGANMFKTACVMAFGHRFLSVAEDRLQTRRNHTLFTLNSDYKEGGCRLVKGERAHQCPPNYLAVYHSIFAHSPEEDFMTALFHQCDPMDFLLHENVYGSLHDEVNYSSGRLTIHTNTGSVTFSFDDKELLHLIYQYRQQQRLITGAALLGRDSNDGRDFVDLMTRNIIDIDHECKSGLVTKLDMGCGYCSPWLYSRYWLVWNALPHRRPSSAERACSSWPRWRRACAQPTPRRRSTLVASASIPRVSRSDCRRCPSRDRTATSWSCWRRHATARLS
ncbi:hypothetical protein PENTCL1PPCAC_12595, partial [Pristionchus entomophagus]